MTRTAGQTYVSSRFRATRVRSKNPLVDPTSLQVTAPRAAAHYWVEGKGYATGGNITNVSYTLVGEGASEWVTLPRGAVIVGLGS